MSEPENQSEPEMEEILASIRRIISEDNPESTESEADEEPEAEPSVEPLAAFGVEAPDEEPDEPEEPEAAPRAEDVVEESPGFEDVLDLTRVVNEDGSVVDLKADKAESDAEPKPQAEPQHQSLGAWPVATPAGSAPSGAEAAAGPLISEPTVQSATAVLAEAVRSVTSEPGSGPAEIIGGNRTLEMVVREALLPELKTWLDGNLAALVERIVREEIRKMVRRAENQ